MKKVLSLLIVLTMLVGMISAMSISTGAAAWDGVAATGFAGGNGSQGDPYQIATPGQWEYFAKQCYMGVSYEGKYFKLMNDLTFNEGDASTWAETAPANSVTPVGQDGSSTYAFKGNFDGNGKTISGVYMKVDSHWGGGLFGCTQGATISNLVLTNSAFVFEAKGWAAAVVGENYGELSVSNIYVSDSVYVTSIGCGAIGGIIGGLEADSVVTVTDCVFAGTVAAESGSTGGEAGGIIGSCTQKPVTVSNCLFLGTVEGRTNQGGITGGTVGAESEISNCVSAGTVKYAFAAKIADTSVTYIYDSYYIGEKAKNTGNVENVVEMEAITDVIGLDCPVTIEGWTKRANDIMVPSGVAAFAPSTTSKYSSKYTVTWKDEDGTVLDTEEYDIGEVPTFKGEEPTKEGDETYNYTFSGWTPSVVAVSGDAEYTAKFVKVRNIVAEEDEDETTKKETQTTAPATTTASTSATTDAANAEGGCGSVIGGGILMLALMAGGATVVCKKKED